MQKITQAEQAHAKLQHFIGTSQRNFLWNLIQTSEEKEWFQDKAIELAATVEKMPKSYETDGQGNAAIAYLRYFHRNGWEWYITEKDKGSYDDEPKDAGKQFQAFGLVKGWEIELGYISIEEIIRNGAELDYHWTPKPLSEVRKMI